MSEIIKTKYLILGAGPAGLQMGYFMEKGQQDYIILEKASSAGSFYKTQPVHRKLLSINKKYNFYEEEEFNERQDWNSLLCDDKEMKFPNYSEELFPQADDLVRYLEDFSSFYKLNIQYNSEANHIEKNQENQFRVTTTNGDVYQGEVLLLGLGAITSLTPENIEGIEHTTSYEEQSVNLEDYKNKRVAIIGAGNSAFETANYLSPVAGFVHVLCRNPPKFAWETHYPGDIRAVNNDIFDMYQLKSLHAVLNPKIKKITKLPNGNLQTHHEYDYPESKVPGTLQLTREYDHIIRCTGWRWVNQSLFSDEIIPETKTNGKFPAMNESWESVNVNDMFFIGAAMQGNDRKSASGFIHGFRYNIRTLYHLLVERYESVSYPSIEYKPFVWNSFVAELYDRLSMSAGMYQLFGTLGDLLIFSEDKKQANYFKELPLCYMPKLTPSKQHVLSISLEFGFHHYPESSLSFLGPSDPNETEKAAFLHPVIRHYYDGEVEEFHFGDSLLARWDLPHGDGGAVMSYHLEFQKWIKNTIGIHIDIPEVIEGGPFHKWPTYENQEQLEETKPEMESIK
jgi:thioredoxin reductase